MAILLGLVTAVLFGAGDFFGGLSAKRVSVLYVVAFSHVVGLIGALIAAPFVAESFAMSDLLLGAAGGGFGGVGVALLYRGLARGPMAVVAPLTAIMSAAVPALWGVATGERFTFIAWVGIAVALVAIGLASIPSAGDSAPVTPTVIVESLLAGIGFGTMFIFFDAANDTSAPWPVVGARILTVTALVGFIILRARPAPGSLDGSWKLIAVTGLFDTTSNVVFIVATGFGDLTIVAVLSALYPVSTVLLARFVLDERMSRTQLGGLVAALAATVLIAAG